MDFKKRPLYNPLERLKNDMSRSPAWGYYFILTIWFIIITMILSATPSKAGNELTFNLNPPKVTAGWTIPVLIGNFNEYQHHWMTYAWTRWQDKEFMYMMASENGLFNHDRKSLVPGEDSWGFCQIHRYYHPRIVNDPRFLTDPAWQLEQCYNLFTGGTKFYGHDRFKKSEREGTEFARARKALFNF